MKNILKVNFEKKAIIMYRTFAKKCADTRSEEYAQLQRVRADYPNFTISTRTCRKNESKESYKGLTYAYMEHYILTHEDKDTVLEVLDTYNEMRLIAECHSKSRRYPAIKRWFLAKYPEIVEFGILQIPVESNSNTTVPFSNSTKELARTGTEG